MGMHQVMQIDEKHQPLLVICQIGKFHQMELAGVDTEEFVPRTEEERRREGRRRKSVNIG